MAEASIIAFQLSEIIAAIVVIAGLTVSMVIGVLIARKYLGVKEKQ